ncbi:MAG: hypothetical protein ACLSFT_06705 [Ruminococcus callidus]
MEKNYCRHRCHCGTDLLSGHDRLCSTSECCRHRDWRCGTEEPMPSSQVDAQIAADESSDQRHCRRSGTIPARIMRKIPTLSSGRQTDTGRQAVPDHRKGTITGNAPGTTDC